MLFWNGQGFGHCGTRSYIPKFLRHTCLSILCPFFLSTMQRSMSYRKPVPTYIPSPPSSPRQSIFPPSTQPNLDLEVPPMPPNWREVLDQVGMLPPRPNAESYQLLPTVTGECNEQDMTELASSVVLDNLTIYGDQVVLPGIRSTSNVPWTHKRRHQQYRPPTPPIPSQHKSQQSLLNSDSNSEVTLMNHDIHRQIDHLGLYHDYPRGGPGASSLKISPSFRTMGTFNTSNPSVAFHAMRTGELSNYSSLLNHEHHNHLHKIAGDTSESMEPSCWESLGACAKKIWDFVIICK